MAIWNEPLVPIEEREKEIPLVDCCDKTNHRYARIGSIYYTDLTHGKGMYRNMYCHLCGAHIWKGKQYTKDAWSAMIDEAL